MPFSDNSFDASLIPQALLTLCQRLQQAGGRAWLVGGSVRDVWLGMPPKDWDVEVYGLPAEALHVCLQSLGRCAFVGQQFGVSKLWFQGLEVDVALPRQEIKTAAGHRGFTVTPDPFMSPEDASLRRDFTINAMMFDPLTHEFLDFHHGLADLRAKKLKHVSAAFGEDPLRPLRAMQFAARFQLDMDDDTAHLCQCLRAEAETLPTSRIWQEWKKWAMADTPSYGLQALRKMGWLTLYPELQALVACPQDTYWHPEGDVWIHTCLVVDAAAKLRLQRALSAEDQLGLMMAALCHDLGKPATTYQDSAGKICAPKHDEVGKSVALQFLKRIAAPKQLKNTVLPLVQEHMAHFYGQVSRQAVLHLAYRLSPVRLGLWEILTEADASGRTPAPASRPALAWLEQAEASGVVDEKIHPVVTGKLLLAWGYKPSAAMGEVLHRAYMAQLDAVIMDKDTAKIWLGKNNLAV